MVDLTALLLSGYSRHMTTETIHPIITEAPNYEAWAGDGPNAAAIHASSWINALDDFRALVSDELYEHAGDFDHIDTEGIAAQVLLNYDDNA